MARWQCRTQIVCRFGLSLCVLAALTVLGCTPSSDETASDDSIRHADTHLELALPRQTDTGPEVSEIVCVVVRVTASDLEEPIGAVATLPRGAASIELSIEVPVGANRRFEVEAFATAEACDVDAISPSFIPNFVPLFQNETVITQDVTTDGVTILIPMESVVGLVVRSPTPPINADGDEVDLLIVARDPSAAPLTFSATGLPPGLSIDPASGFIAGTLSRDASVGSPYTVNTTVSNGTDLDGVTFVWTVTNPAPILTLPFVPVDSRAEGTTVAEEPEEDRLQAEASDPDGDPLVFSATGLPPDLSINASTGLISGTLTNTAAVGSPYTVSVTVSDGLDSTSLDFILSVTNPVPMITSPGDQSSAEGVSVALEIEASDPDGDTLVFSATGLPPDLAINAATGLITGTLANMAAAGSPYTVTVTVSDGSASASVTFTWVVNAAPVIIPLGNQRNTEGDTVNLQIQATDPEGDSLTFSITGRPTVPPDLTIDAATGLITGTLTNTAAGNSPYTVTVTASDGSTSSSVTFSWEVINPAPVITNLGNQRHAEGEDITFQIEARDPDGDSLTFSATGLPPNLSINTGNGRITGTLTNSAAAGSPYTVTVRASDGSASDSDTFSWEVFNPAPSISNPGDQRNAAGDAVTLQIEARDPDGDSLTFSATGLPPNLSIDAAIGLITGTIAPTASVGSPYTVTITVSDGLDSASDTFTWVINSAPVVTAPVMQTNAEGDAVTLQIQASDPDGGPLTFNATGLPPNLSINATTGLITGTLATMAAVGSPYTVTVTVSDGSASASATFTWVVTPPEPMIAITDQTTTESDTKGAVFTVSLSVAADQTATVDFATADDITADNSATAGSGYQPTSGTLTFAPGTTSQTLAVPVFDNEVAESDKTFVVNLSNASNATIDDNQGVATITDDDDSIVVSSQGMDEILRYDGQTGAFIDAFVTDDPATPQIDETGGLHVPSHLLLGSDDRLYVSSQGTNQILRYDGQTGAFIDAFVTDDPATPQVNETGGLHAPGGIVFGPDGHLYVSSLHTDEVLYYDGQTGAFLGAFIPTTRGGLDAPGQLVFGPVGHLYVSSQGTDEILRYDGQTGTFLGIHITIGSVSTGQTDQVGLVFVRRTRSAQPAAIASGSTGQP